MERQHSNPRRFSESRGPCNWSDAQGEWGWEAGNAETVWQQRHSLDPVMRIRQFALAAGEIVLDAVANIQRPVQSFIVGCTSLLGRAGIGLSAVETMFVSNPLSGATMPWQFLAAPWGAMGQHMVPGASSSLIRSLSYFPEASTAQQRWMLGVWTLGGMVLALIGHFCSKESMHVPESTLEAPHAGKHAS